MHLKLKSLDNMKLNRCIVCAGPCLLIVVITCFVLHNHKLFLVQESFLPFEDEAKASEDDFVDLEYYDFPAFGTNTPGDTSDTLEQHILTVPAKELPTQSTIHLLEGYGHSSLTPRMWCAVEAATRTNPQASVTLHMRATKLLLTPLVTALTATAPNLQVVTLDLDRLIGESSLRHWYQEKTWETSFWPVSHFNDALRWLLLYHYGGVYLDLDSLSVRALTPPLYPHPGFAGLESHRWVGAGVIGVPHPHHWLPRAALDKMASNFDGSEWGTNGPKLLTRVLAERCGPTPPDSATPSCEDFTVLPPRSFYPVPWWEHHRYTEVDKDNALSSNLLSDPTVRVVHIWQHLTKNAAISLHPEPKTSPSGLPANKGAGPRRLRQFEAIRAAVHDSRRSSRSAEESVGMKASKIPDEGGPLQPVAAIARAVCPVTVALAGQYL